MPKVLDGPPQTTCAEWKLVNPVTEPETTETTREPLQVWVLCTTKAAIAAGARDGDQVIYAVTLNDLKKVYNDQAQEYGMKTRFDDVLPEAQQNYLKAAASAIARINWPDIMGQAITRHWRRPPSC